MSQAFSFPTSAPEAQGVLSSGVLAFVKEVDQRVKGMHGFMLLRHGVLIAQGWWSPYRAELPHTLYSLSKSFTSTAVGMAVDEGRLSIDDPVLSFFPDEAPSKVSANLAAMRVRHLLSMCTGHSQDTPQAMASRRDKNYAKGFLAQPVTYQPGTHFLYNSGASYMLSAIVHKLVGMPILDYLQPRLFQPLGIQVSEWESCPKGINVGGWGLSLKTEDIARFGQLYLQKGVWQGRRLLSDAWIAQASAKQIDNGSNIGSDWEQGYGFQFWRCQNNFYRGDGAFGQYCVVMDDLDAVLAINSGVTDMQAVLNAVWKYLLPAFKPEALAANGEAAGNLARKTQGLAIKPPKGAKTSPLAKSISGQRYDLEPNPAEYGWLALDLSQAGGKLTFEDRKGRHELDFGNGSWLEGQADFFGSSPIPGKTSVQRTAASGTWTAQDTYTITTHFIETPYCLTLTFRFGGDQVFFDFKMNVGFGPQEMPTITGQIRKGSQG